MPGDADGSGAACVATPPSHYACAHGQRMRAWHLLAGSPSLSGLSCQQIQQARISTGVARQTDAESPHFASPPCRKRSGAGRVCVALGGACGHECGLKRPAAHPRGHVAPAVLSNLSCVLRALSVSPGVRVCVGAGAPTRLGASGSLALPNEQRRPEISREPG